MPVRSDRGQAALRQGDYPAAAGHFEAVLHDHPLAARLGLGVALYRLRDLDRASDNLARVVAGSPQHRDAQLFLGLTAPRRGDQASARNGCARTSHG